MSPKTYLFSQYDYDQLVKRLFELGKKLEEINKEIKTSTEESSETWHDNWGYEEGMRQNLMFSKQIENYNDILKRSTIVSTPDPDTLLGYKVRFIRNNIEKEIIIGSYHSFSEDKNVVSYNAPIVLAIKNVDSKENIKVISIEPYPDFFR